MAAMISPRAMVRSFTVRTFVVNARGQRPEREQRERPVRCTAKLGGSIRRIGVLEHGSGSTWSPWSVRQAGGNGAL